eukprot:TRINITY_DN2126_c0_g1_i1.p1 TRINITY_DN2126_c0_g1~~TRINITY_DN2126_c0_g1_i1.p1  ORF type:complete len:212 (+),score=52.33 TRINITY_DN2126_c0_g1_i1:175-810(+)
MGQPEDYDYIFKVVLLGDSGTGKTNICSRFTKGEFSEQFKATLGVDFAMKIMNIEKKRIKIQLWDTAGQERFRTITTAYYRGTVGALLCYDITKPETFENAARWLDELRFHSDVPELTIMLVGTKSDLSEMRAVSTETGSKYAEEQGLAFVETSALQNLNIDKAFEILVSEIYSKQSRKRLMVEEQQRATEQYETVHIQQTQPSSTNPCCR